MRDAWQELHDLKEDEPEAVDRRRELEERRQEAERTEREYRERVAAAEAERVRYDYSGYPVL